MPLSIETHAHKECFTMSLRFNYVVVVAKRNHRKFKHDLKYAYVSYLSRFPPNSYDVCDNFVVILAPAKILEILRRK